MGDVAFFGVYVFVVFFYGGVGAGVDLLGDGVIVSFFLLDYRYRIFLYRCMYLLYNINKFEYISRKMILV